MVWRSAEIVHGAALLPLAQLCRTLASSRIPQPAAASETQSSGFFLIQPGVSSTVVWGGRAEAPVSAFASRARAPRVVQGDRPTSRSHRE